jgi:acetate kinase
MHNSMIVLTINSGSTSIKLCVYDAAAGMKPVCLRSERHAGDADPRKVLPALLETLNRRPQRVAHRVVHGGTRFVSATLIDQNVIAALEQLSELAPLHNPLVGCGA